MNSSSIFSFIRWLWKFPSVAHLGFFIGSATSESIIHTYLSMLADRGFLGFYQERILTYTLLITLLLSCLMFLVLFIAKLITELRAILKKGEFK